MKAPRWSTHLSRWPTLRDTAEILLATCCHPCIQLTSSTGEDHRATRPCPNSFLHGGSRRGAGAPPQTQASKQAPAAAVACHPTRTHTGRLISIQIWTGIGSSTLAALMRIYGIEMFFWSHYDFCNVKSFVSWCFSECWLFCGFVDFVFWLFHMLDTIFFRHDQNLTEWTNWPRMTENKELSTSKLMRQQGRGIALTRTKASEVKQDVNPRKQDTTWNETK